MGLIACLLAGLVLGAGGVWWLQRGEVVYLRAELRVATDRLLGAWKEGAVVPSRPAEPLPPPEPLPPDLAEIVTQWEDPESRAVEEQNIRDMLERGMRPIGILRHYEGQHPG